MVAEMNMNANGGVPVIDFDFVKSVVDGHTHTYDFTTTNDRANITAGGVYVDTINKMVYLYAEYTILKTETPSSWNTTIMFGSTTYDFNLAPYASASVTTRIINIESTTATNSPEVNFYPYSSNTLRIGHTKKYTVGETFKIWGVWSASKA